MPAHGRRKHARAGWRDGSMRGADKPPTAAPRCDRLADNRHSIRPPRFAFGKRKNKGARSGKVFIAQYPTIRADQCIGGELLDLAPLAAR